MKTIRIFGTRGLTLILGAALGVSVGFASPAFAQVFRSDQVIVNPDGKVTYLGTLGGDYSHAEGINDAGQVVGYSITADGSSHAFITGPNGMGMTDLGTLSGKHSQAFGINDSGQVVGAGFITADGFSHAFITGPNGMGMTDLGTLGGRHSFAYDINDSGQVVGFSTTADGSLDFFITGPNGMGMTDLGFWGGVSSVLRINDSGRVVRTGETADGFFHAFITGPNGMGMTDLGTLGGRHSFATGINDSGQVAGYFETTAEDSSHAFITGPNGVGMTDLGTLGGGFSFSRASDINDSGQVVGQSTTPDGSFNAFITGPNGVGMTDLNSYADLPDGVYLSSAAAINNLGQVLATVYPIPPIPEPASYALMLAGLGLVGFMARRKKLPGTIVARG